MNPLLTQLEQFEKQVKAIAAERDSSRSCCDELHKELTAAYARIGELERQLPPQPTLNAINERMLALTEPTIFMSDSVPMSAEFAALAATPAPPVCVPDVVAREASDVQT